ncbi:MAG: ABC transporter permease [Thermoplasmata archaeon]|nr:ABC transporter permease [Thermoplasmata archaeon]
MPWRDRMTSDLWHVTMMTIAVSGTATLIAAGIGIPLGTRLALREFLGKRAIKVITYMMYGFPPVLAGLLIYLLLSNEGPLGSAELLFTPWAMIIAQVLLVTPIITGLTLSAISEVGPDVKDTAQTLGADDKQVSRTVISEAKVGVVSAVMVGFGRAIAEVGAVIIVGGNIKWHTRVLTTSIVLETRQANFEYALVLGAILLTVAATVFIVLQYYQEGDPR